jgi:hypothetical protein
MNESWTGILIVASVILICTAVLLVIATSVVDR